MQATLPALPTHVPVHIPMQQMEPRPLGAFGGALYAAATGGTAAILITASALLGEKILQAAGNDNYNLPSYANLLVPALVGTTVIWGSVGMLAGACNQLLGLTNPPR